MKLYWAPQTRSTRAFWMLEEASVEYDTELVDIRSDKRQDSAEFLAASPMGKVPAIVEPKADHCVGEFWRTFERDDNEVDRPHLIESLLQPSKQIVESACYLLVTHLE